MLLPCNYLFFFKRLKFPRLCKASGKSKNLRLQPGALATLNQGFATGTEHSQLPPGGKSHPEEVFTIPKRAQLKRNGASVYCQNLAWPP